MNYIKRFLLINILLVTVLLADNNEFVKDNNFLEISKNYMEVHNVHNKVTKSQKLIDNLEMINFSMKPSKRVIKSLDSLNIVYAYPLEIFLPKNTTVTKAILSNSKVQPIISHNMILVSVDKQFLSGLLDVFYFYNSSPKNGKTISIKLDKYTTTSKNINIKKLYTQVMYFKAKKLNFQKILASLKPFEYGLSFSQIKYQDIIYDIKLVNIVKNGKILKQNMNNKYINCSIEYGGREYNYYVQ